MKIFIDTNIFLDLILKRENFDKALLIFNAVEQKIFSSVISDISILNIDYIARKQIKDIKDFLRLINSNFEVIGGSNKMFDKALLIENNDLEDNIQYLSAKQLNCDVIITNDKQFFSKDIKLLTSSEFVKEYLSIS